MFKTLGYVVNLWRLLKNTGSSGKLEEHKLTEYHERNKNKNWQKQALKERQQRKMTSLNVRMNENKCNRYVAGMPACTLKVIA